MFRVVELHAGRGTTTRTGTVTVTGIRIGIATEIEIEIETGEEIQDTTTDQSRWRLIDMYPLGAVARTSLRSLGGESAAGVEKGTGIGTGTGTKIEIATATGTGHVIVIVIGTTNPENPEIGAAIANGTVMSEEIGTGRGIKRGVRSGRKREMGKAGVGAPTKRDVETRIGL
jgi:hypothetical protein